MIDLKITAIKDLWTVNTLHGTEQDTSLPREKILQRDDYTCRCCGWRSKKFQEIHHIDHNHENNNEKNLATLCPICHQVFHLPTVSTLKGGRVIWLPEMSQETLNVLCINIFMGFRQEKISGMAKNIYAELIKRGDFVDENIGRGDSNGSDPGIFAQAMIEIGNNPNAKKELDEKIKKYFRLLPSPERFETQIEYWVKEKKVFGKEKHHFLLMENQFSNMYERIKDKL